MNENDTLMLDGAPVTREQLNEAMKNKSVRIIEDKENPGHFRTLKHLRESA